MQKIKINSQNIKTARTKLANSFKAALNESIEVAKNNTPVDTSSLQESIDGSIEIIGKKIVFTIKAGGEDYSDQVMLSTGKTGNIVDYAKEQNDIHEFMEIGIDHFKNLIC